MKMQIQYETRVLDETPFKADDWTIDAGRKTLDSYTLCDDRLNTVELIACCPAASSLIAVYSGQTNQMNLVDLKLPQGKQKRERFPLKACDKRFSRQSFVAKAIDFSPDGSRLAVGQSDCIIYIYKLPTIFFHQQTANLASSSNIPLNQSSNANNQASSSAAKPTISGKFTCSTPVIKLVWTEFGLIFVCQDGRLRLIATQATPRTSTIDQAQLLPPVANDLSAPNLSTKVINLHTVNSMPLSLAYRSSNILAVGCVDGQVHILLLSAILGDQQIAIDSSESTPHHIGAAMGVKRASIQQTGSGQQASQNSIVSLTHSCPVYCLAISHNNVLFCAGPDGRLALYVIQVDATSSQNLKLNWLQNIELRDDIVSIDYSVINETLAIATTTRLLFVKFDQQSSAWQLQSSRIDISNTMSLTSVFWTKDGSQLLLGTVGGALLLFNCTWGKQSLGEQFDICHIARNRVRITDRARNLLATYKTQADIKRVNLLDQGMSVIIWTSRGILLARLDQQQYSEIEWPREKSPNVKFCFDYLGYVLIQNVTRSELLIIKLGNTTPVYSVKLNSVRKGAVCVRKYPQLLHAASDVFQSQSAGGSITQPSNKSTQGAPESLIGEQLIENRKKKLFEDDEMEEPPNKSLDVAQVFASEQVERLAYIDNDHNSLVVINLKNANKDISLRHSDRIIWLELNQTASELVFKDNLKKLHLLRLSRSESDSRQTFETRSSLIVDECEFSQWLPGSNILIAQSAHEILMWYSMDELNGLGAKPAKFNAIRLDVRSFNPSKASPIVDLSLKIKSYPVIKEVVSYDYIRLSNGQLVPLDKLRVQFELEVCNNRLQNALNVIEKSLSSSTKNSDENLSRRADATCKLLFRKLGWLAVERGQIEVAIRSFELLNYDKLVKHLSSHCMKLAENEENSTNRKWVSIAKLCGDWPKFERICYEQPEEIVATYRRLNKWSRLIEYLTKQEQFRQRDLAERDFRLWLTAQGRHFEAAHLLVSSGDLPAGLELLMDEGKPSEAAKLLFDRKWQGAASSSPPEDLLERLERGLIEGNYFLEAARLNALVRGRTEKAFEFYLKAEAYGKARDLATVQATTGDIKWLSNLHEAERHLGVHLMTQFRLGRVGRRRAKQAVTLLWNAGERRQSLEAALELDELAEAGALVARAGPEISELGELTLKVGERLAACEQLQLAVECLIAGGHHERAIELCIEAHDFRRAHSLAVEKDGKVVADERFLRLAAELEGKTEQVADAEQLYLMAGSLAKAVEVNRKCGRLERALELVEEHEPDQLEAELLLAAKQMESQGDLAAAESYLLRASPSEWPGVVRMYRLAGEWAAAYRVASSNCTANDPLLTQLAYLWAKWLIGRPVDELQATTQAGETATTPDVLSTDRKSPETRACELLSSLGQLERVIEFCCEQKNFKFALEMSKHVQDAGSDNNMKPGNELRKRLAGRFAAHLEREAKFSEAELILTEAGLIEEAAKMHLDNERYEDAIRLLERQLAHATRDSTQESSDSQKRLTNILQRTLIECADRLVEKATYKSETGSRGGDHLGQAQQHYLRAQRPELAVEMYRKRGLWREALQIAHRFAPQLVESIELELDTQTAAELSPAVQTSAMPANNTMQQISRTGAILSPISIDQVASSQSRGGEPLAEQAERCMNTGDLRGARRALERLLDSIARGPEIDESGGGLTTSKLSESLARFEQLLEKLAATGSEAEPDLVSLEKLPALADRVFASGGTLGRLAAAAISGESRSSAIGRELLIKLRNLLLVAHELSFRSVPSTNLQLIERRLMAAHLMSLQATLASHLAIELGIEAPTSQSPSETIQSMELLANSAVATGRGELLELIAKLAFSSIQFGDLVEGRALLYNAGLWLLAVDRRHLTQIAWSRLLELAEESPGASSDAWSDANQKPNSINQQQLEELAGAPTNWLLLGACPISPAELADLRAWLLQSLITGPAGSGGSSTKRKLPDSSDWELSGAGTWLQGQDSPCLVSGLTTPPKGATNRIELGTLLDRKLVARRSEWRFLLTTCQNHVSGPSRRRLVSRSLLRLRRTTPAVRVDKLADVIQFIARLCKRKLEEISAS